MSYLVDLTLRLATGMGQLPEAVRSRHSGYLLARQNADGGFSGREGGSDLYYTGFALRGLAMTGELQGAAAERAADFLRLQLHNRVAIIDFLSLVYGASLLEISAGVDVFARAPAGWRDAVAAELERYRRSDGGYAKTDEGQSSSTYYTFLMVLCNELIGRPSDDPQRIIEFIRSRQRGDGGFVELGPMQRSGTNPTAAAVGVLKTLGALDDATRDATLDFVADMQNEEGGLRANTRIPIADVLSTFTGLLTLLDLGGLDEVDLSAVSRYVNDMQQPDGGFRGAAWDDAVDVEYTFYGLGSLALLASTESA
jgi:geranylgeranyl transferase type-2 subunit beta